MPLHQSLSAKCTSTLRYFSFGIHFGHFGIKTNRKLIAHVLPLLLQFWRCALEEDVLVQDQLDNREDVERVVHHREYSTIKKTRELVARKYYGDLQLLSMPTHCQKGTSYNSILVIIGWFTKMIHYKSVQIPIDAPRLSDFIVNDWDPAFTSKFWFFWYYFQVRLRLPPTRLL